MSFFNYKPPQIIVTQQDLGYNLEATPHNRKVVDKVSRLIVEVIRLTNKIEDLLQDLH